MRYTLKLTSEKSINDVILSIPKHGVTEICFEGGLNLKQHNDMLALIKKIPSNYDTLDLSNTCLSRVSETHLCDLIINIPPHIKTIKLTQNRLGLKTDTELKSIFSALPLTLITLYLDQNDLGAHDATVFEAIPSTIQQLHVVNNQLTNEAFITILNRHASVYVGYTKFNPTQAMIESAAQMNGLRLLDVGRNDLHTKLEPFSAMLSRLPNLSELRVASNDLNSCGTAGLVNFVQSLPDGLGVLDLGVNNLWRLGSQGLINVIMATKPEIHTLILDKNELQSVDYLVNVFLNIPEHIKTISLDRNPFGALDDDTFVSLIQSIPPHVTCISLRNTQFFLDRTSLQKNELERRLMAAKPACNLVFDNSTTDVHNLMLTLAHDSRNKSSFLRFAKLSVDLLMEIIQYLMPRDHHAQDLYSFLSRINVWSAQPDIEGRIMMSLGEDLNTITFFQRPFISHQLLSHLPITTTTPERININPRADVLHPSPDVRPAFEAHFLLQIGTLPVFCIGALLVVAAIGTAAGLGMFGLSMGLASAGGVMLVGAGLATGYRFFCDKARMDGAFQEVNDADNALLIISTV